MCLAARRTLQEPLTDKLHGWYTFLQNMTEWPVWLVALGLTWSALILFGLLAFALFKLMDRLSRSSTAAPIAAESFTSEHPSAAHIQIDEPSLLYHFRHCVKAVLQLAQVSPESHDFALNTHPKKHLSSSASGSRRTLKKRASVRRLRPALPLRKPGSRQSLKDGTNPGPGINGTVKKSPLPPFLLDRSFSLAEHTHEWILSSLGRVKFTDHAPVLFQYIRSQLGYSMESLVASLESPLELWTTEGKSEARKGFYYFECSLLHCLYIMLR